ncbi:hypothetical protein EON65_45930 [archaeon]|nr:MAG: hypothetical protein EON65_45930 [archaeon]
MRTWCALSLMLSLFEVTCSGTKVRVASYENEIEYCATLSMSQEQLRSIQADLQPFLDSYHHNQPLRTPVKSLRHVPYKENILPLAENVVIPVYFHVIMASSGQGQVQDSAISQQIAVLNSDYGSTGFQFSLRGKMHSNLKPYISCSLTICALNFRDESDYERCLVQHAV